ncbi:hypothetical protein [Nibricoccus aquaticus]|nr:hypothetical protein [Nibricoccus aquaticus]
MKLAMFTLALLAVATSAFFAKMAWADYRRFRLLRARGVRAKGHIIGQAPRRIGEAPLPVVRFEDSSGATREFHSRFPRRTRGFIHPEEVDVIYHGDAAEIATASYARRWIGGTFAFAVACTVIGCLFALLSLR